MGAGAKELCLRHGVSDARFYKWRFKYVGMELSDAKWLKALETETAKPKKLLAEQMMDVSTLKPGLSMSRKTTRHLVRQTAPPTFHHPGYG